MSELELEFKVRQFIEYEGKSCSMDPGLITPLYVYRMWGGNVSYGDIVAVMQRVNKK